MEEPTRSRQLIKQQRGVYSSTAAFFVLWGFCLLLLGALIGLTWDSVTRIPLLIVSLGIFILGIYERGRRVQSNSAQPMFESLFTQTNDAVFLLDLQGNHILVNQRAAEMLGYTPEELAKLSFRDIVVQTEQSHSENILSRLLAGETIPIYERVFRSKSGETIPVELNVQLIKDSANKPLHIQSVVRDIRQRKLSEQQLATFVSALPDRAVILDYDGNYRQVLKTSLVNQTLSGTELVGHNIAEFVDADAAAFCISMIRKTLAERKVQSFEYSYQTDNTSYYFDGRTVPYYDNQTDETLVMWITRDTTESKIAAKVLIESEQRLRAFASALPDRAIILDAEGYYREILKEHYQNLPIRLPNAIGKRLHDLFDAETVEFYLSKIHETIALNQTLVFDYEAIIEGKTYYLDGRTVPSQDPKTGEPLVIWISRDISRLKHAETTLKYQNRLHSLITSLALDFVNLPVAAMDDSIMKALRQVGEFIGADRSYINSVNLHTLETSIAYECYAANVPKLVDKTRVKNLELHSWSLEQFRRGETINIPSVAKLTKDAEVEKQGLAARGIKSVLSIPLLRNGNLIGTLGFHAILAEKSWTEETSDLLKILGEIYVNALQRKEIEEALMDSEKRLRILINSLPDRTVIFDREGNFHEILKEDYETGEIAEVIRAVRQGQNIKDVYSAEFAEFVQRKINKSLDKNLAEVIQYQSPLQGIDCDLEARIIPFRDPQTKEERVFWVTRDISEQVQAEKHRLELSLEREKIEVLRQFVDSVTHDLKTPLTVIGTSLHLLEQSPPDKRQARIAIIQKQLGLLSHMLEELLAVARLDQIPQLQFSRINFDNILNDVIEFLRPKAELKRINLEVAIHKDIPPILASQDELSRALSNLIDNAIKYTPDDGAVTIRVKSDEAQLIFEVQDTGIGIGQEDIEHVFERFFRTDKARSEAPGTGLGLEITQRIIELHGGKIELESALNQGTTFRVWLPLNRDEANALNY